MIPLFERRVNQAVASGDGTKRKSRWCGVCSGMSMIATVEEVIEKPPVIWSKRGLQGSCVGTDEV